MKRFLLKAPGNKTYEGVMFSDGSIALRLRSSRDVGFFATFESLDDLKRRRQSPDDKIEWIDKE